MSVLNAKSMLVGSSRGSAVVSSVSAGFCAVVSGALSPEEAMESSSLQSSRLEVSVAEPLSVPSLRA